MARLIAEASADGIRVAVVMIPHERPHPLTARLEQSLTAAGAVVINLRRDMDTCGYANCYYTRDDDHWNARGHEVAALALVNAVSSHRLLDR